MRPPSRGATLTRARHRRRAGAARRGHRGARRRLPRRGRRARGGRAAGGRPAARRRHLGPDADAARRGRAAHVPDAGARRNHVLADRVTVGRHRPHRVVVGDLSPSVHRARLHRTVLRGRARASTTHCRSGRTARACTTCAGRSHAHWACARNDWWSATSRAPGCYGHNGADDAAMDAALLALAAPGQTGAGGLVAGRRAGLGTAGTRGRGAGLGRHRGRRHRVVLAARDLERQLHQPPRHDTNRLHSSAASHRARDAAIHSKLREPPLERGGGTRRNAVPGYDFPAYEVVNHLLPRMPLRTSALRSLGAHLNVFAAESFMDELAAEAGRDPLEFRLATCPTRAPGPCWKPLHGGRIGQPADAVRTRSGTASAMRATRTPAPTVRSSPRSRPSTGPGAPADDRRRRRAGHQPGRRGQPDRGRRDPGRPAGR